MWEKIKSILTTTKYQVRIGLAVVLIFLGGYNLFFIGDDEGHGDNISIKIESGMSTEEIAQNLQEHAIINNGLGFRILAMIKVIIINSTAKNTVKRAINASIPRALLLKAVSFCPDKLPMPAVLPSCISTEAIKPIATNASIIIKIVNNIFILPTNLNLLVL